MNTFKLTFDLVEFDRKLMLKFHSFGLKLTKFYDIGNCDVVEFEGTYDQLENWYNEYIDSGESFKEYFDEFHFKVIRTKNEPTKII